MTAAAEVWNMAVTLVAEGLVVQRELPPKTPPMDIRLQTKLKKLNINQLFLEQSVVFNREV